jgi:hypothetical protein
MLIPLDDRATDLGAEVGVFGGSGFYDFLSEATDVEITTPYGPAAAPIAVGTLGGRRSHSLLAMAAITITSLTAFRSRRTSGHWRRSVSDRLWRRVLSDHCSPTYTPGRSSFLTK